MRLKMENVFRTVVYYRTVIAYCERANVFLILVENAAFAGQWGPLNTSYVLIIVHYRTERRNKVRHCPLTVPTTLCTLRYSIPAILYPNVVCAIK